MTLPIDKLAGVCLHISSLPGPFGIGDIGEQAHEFVSTLRSMGVRVWQFLPLGPVGYGNSPYQPLSIYAGNEMLIALDPLIADGFVAADETSLLQGLTVEYTDYAKMIPLKRDLLHLAAKRFSHHVNESTLQAFNRFTEEHNEAWLHNYALFRVLKTRHDERAWPEWGKQYVRRNEVALEKLNQSAAAEIHQYKVLQFWFYSQWQQLRTHAAAEGLTLMGDIPIYIGLDSADAWVQPELLEISRDGEPDCVAGVPPDYFSADGQLWGNPLYDWEHHEQTDYTWWKNRFRSALHQMDVIRLDHFRGFESYWSVPADAVTARDGKWRAGPADKLFRSVRDSMGDLPFIAEDLGLITDAVREFLHRWQFPGMNVLQFMVGNEDFSAHDIIYNSVCYTGTHDNDTTVGWFHGAGDDESVCSQVQSTVLTNISGQIDTLHVDMIRFALNTEARLCIIPLQDILGLGSETRLNTPGTTADNWRWRLAPGDTHVSESLCEQVRAMVVSSGRSI